MTDYLISWLTESLGLGHAPLSHGEMESMRQQGINAIVNLCGEFCNLHEIQKEYDFEVYYLPTCDNEVPSMDELEKALDWLDEALYLGKKVLVHCRFGIGRTATFVMAYLLRKGYGLKLARKRVEETRAVSSSFSQWRLLRKYHKQAGTLEFRQPSLDNGPIADLNPYFQEYETLLNLIDHAFQRTAETTGGGLLSCGLESEACCYRPVDLQFIEAAYLNHKMSLHLTSTERKEAIQRAVGVSKKIGDLEKRLRAGSETKDDSHKFAEIYAQEEIRCPLNVNSRCTVYPIRPTACRLYGLPVSHEGKVRIFADQGEVAADGARLDYDQVDAVLARTSENMFHALTTSNAVERRLVFTLADAVSGKFVQKYFEYLNSSK
ncbi:MAG: dual specificity protein phosphatase family protein [Syntrophobacterales bacterium]|jgi:protein-tyrosine phosphatase/Fe-S-cluster containining protein